MAKMSHNEAQRKAWHAGKRRAGETMSQWFNRVIVRGKNFRGAYTPVGLHKRVTYEKRL